MSFGENLQRLRKKKGMSQERLAEILEVSRQAISKWESNIAYPEIEKLIALSNLFDVSIDSMIKGDESNGAVDGGDSSEGGRRTDKEVHKDAMKEPLAPVHQYHHLRIAFAIILYAISPFWFYLLGEQPGGSGKGVFLMFFSISVATGLLLYNRFTKHKEGEK